MRRFLPTLCILLMLVGGAVPVARAADGDLCDFSNAGSQDGIMQSGHCVSNGTYGFNNTSGTYAENVAANQAADTAASNATIAATANTPVPPKPDPDAAWGDAMQRIMGLFAWLVGAAALTLDYATYFTVVNMGSYVKNLNAIGITWQILRDIGNIMLIFGFLAVGITTILNVDWYGSGTKMLPKMLMAAVFLNFSLFISEAIIDTGNLFATQFYTQINGNTALNQPSMPGNWTDISNLGQQQGISSKIMNQLGLQTIYGNGTRNTDIFKAGNPWLIGFMGILLFIVTAFVLFSLAFVLIARFIFLIYLIVLAPIGFAGLAVPQLAARAKKWWDDLFQQTITAPILLLMLYIALRVITDAKFLTGFGMSTIAGGASTGFVNNTDIPGFASFILSFIVAMGLLILVVIQSKNLSAFGASWASQTAGKLTFGLTAAGTRSSVGWLSQRASQGWRKTSLSRTPVLGRAVAGVFDRGAKASFDVRGATIGGGLKALSVDAGAAQKGGFRDWEKDKIKGREAYAKDLGQTSGEGKRQKEAEKAKDEAEKNLKDLESQNSRAVQGLSSEHKVALEQYNDNVEEAQKNLLKMQDDQRKGANITQGEMDAARNALTAARTAREQKVSEQRTEQEELKKTHEGLVKVQKEEIKTHQEAVDRLKNAGKEGYARGLGLYTKDEQGKDKEGLLYDAIRLINPQRNTKAAENIRKEAKKSKSDKDLEIIKKTLEEAEKPKEEKPEAPKP